MKLIKSILLTSAFLILSMPVLADDETKSGFLDRGRTTLRMWKPTCTYILKYATRLPEPRSF